MTGAEPHSRPGAAAAAPVPPALLAPLLGFVAGFVDAACFIALAGLFTAHVTGNFVLIGAELVAHSGSGVFGKLLALPVFVLGVAGARLAAAALEGRGRPALPVLLAGEALLLAGAAAAAVGLAPLGTADAPAALLVGMLAVAAMGVQNAAGRLCLASLAPTTVMTLNVTQAVIDGVDFLCGRTLDAAARDRLRRILPAVAAFAAGALAGALGVALAALGSLVLPALVLAGLAGGLRRS